MAVSGGIHPVYTPGGRVSFAVSAAVTAGQLVEVTGDKTVGPAGAGSRKVVGQALQTASASGDVIPVQIFGFISNLTASGAIAAGDEVNPAAAGAVATLAASGAAYVQAEANNARSIVGVALPASSNAATGWILIGKS